MTLGLGTNPTRKIVSVAFGSTVQPTRTLQLLEIALNHAAEITEPFEIALVSGGSTAVIDGATQLFQRYGVRVDSELETADDPFTEHLTAKVFPRLSQPEIAALYRASDAYVSKAGGATTAELIASSTQFVRGFGLWPWEYENALWLGKLGLSRENPVEPADPLRLDTSFLGMEPNEAQVATLVNQTLALPRLYTQVPGALSFDVNTLRGVIDRLLAQ